MRIPEAHTYFISLFLLQDNCFAVCRLLLSHFVTLINEREYTDCVKFRTRRVRNKVQNDIIAKVTKL